MTCVHTLPWNVARQFFLQSCELSRNRQQTISSIRFCLVIDYYREAFSGLLVFFTGCHSVRMRQIRRNSSGRGCRLSPDLKPNRLRWSSELSSATGTGEGLVSLHGTTEARAICCRICRRLWLTLSGGLRPPPLREIVNSEDDNLGDRFPERVNYSGGRDRISTRRYRSALFMHTETVPSVWLSLCPVCLSGCNVRRTVAVRRYK